MEEERDPHGRGLSVIRFIEPRLTPDHRVIVIEWAERLLSIRRSDAPVLEKARRAIQETVQREVVLALLSTSGSALKDLAWDDRTWSGRLGIGAATVAAVAVAGQGAGIAALGGAVGVPLWIVLGAGDSFAGMLIDELSRTLPQRGPVGEGGEAGTSGVDGSASGSGPRESEGQGPDAELAADLLDGLRDGSIVPLLEGEDSARETPPESLWTVFRSAYREARQRQREKPADR